MQIVKPYQYTNGQLIDANQLDANLDTLYTAINGNLDGSNLKTGLNVDINGVIDVKSPAYNASGSALATTGSITSGSFILTLTAALDFVNGQGISIAGASVSGATLVTSIANGAGTTQLTLNTAASTTVAAAVVNHDDATAIRSAITALTALGGGILRIPKGTYWLGNYDTTLVNNRYFIFSIPSNVIIEGEGAASILKVKDNIYPSTETVTKGVNVFLSNGNSNVHFKNIKIDFNGTNNLTPSGATRTFFGMNFEGGSDCSVEGCYFENCPGYNVIVFGGSVHAQRALIRDNYFHNGGRGVTGNIYNGDFSAIYCDWDYAEIDNNIIFQDNAPSNYQGGIESHGNYQKLHDNIITNSFPAVYVASDFTNWAASHVNIVGDVIIPNVGKYTGHKYICTTAGTTSATEPTWTTVTGATFADGTVVWTENGLSATYGQKVFDNIFIDCNDGIDFAGKGDFVGTEIVNNRIELKYSSALSAISSSSTGIKQPRDDTGVFGYSLVLKNAFISGNIIVGKDVLNTALASNVAMNLSAMNGLTISDNQCWNLNAECIIVRGTPFSTNNLFIHDNKFHNFGLNSGAADHWGIYFDFTGAATSPVKSAYDASNIVVKNNQFWHDVLVASSVAFYFNWDAGSTIANFTFNENNITSITTIKNGAKNGSVTLFPEVSTGTSGYLKFPSGVTLQWMKKTVTGANTDNTFTFPTAFTTACDNVTLTPVGASSVTATENGRSATGVTIRCSVTATDVYIFAVGH